MMEEPQAKRTRKAVVDSSLKQKLQDLPLLCVEAICKFTPTSPLIRLYSSAVPLPGAFWNLRLEAALKRRKISIWEDTSDGQNGDARVDALFDSSGAKVATIKHPEAFHLSPLCEFVQSVEVPFRALPSFAAAEGRLRYVISGEPLLPHLPYVSQLTLFGLGDFKKPYPAKAIDNKYFLLPALKNVLPTLESFAFQKGGENRLIPDSTLIEVLTEMSDLKCLDVPAASFGSLMRAATAGSQASEALWHVLSALTSIRFRLALWEGIPRVDVPLLNFMSGCCTRLTHLSLLVRGELKAFLIALRAFANLAVLGLALDNVSTKGMTFSEGEAVTSVLELRLVQHGPHVKGAVASLFPNVKAAALHHDHFTAELCSKAVWPKLEKLTCFPEIYGHDLSVARFLAIPNLPGSVDVSPIIDKDLARDSSTLTNIYQAVQSGPIKTLLLRGPLHREALPRLQAYIDLNGESAKATAWKDRDLGDQTTIRISSYPVNVVVPVTEFSVLTDVRIIGTKKKGGAFTIRVVHQHSKKKTDFFD